MTVQPTPGRRQPDSLADVLERVLDKGVVIAGDIVVNVLDIELLTLKLRLFIASADTAREMGMDWWTTDPFFNSRAAGQQLGTNGGFRGEVDQGRGDRDAMAELEDENRQLRARLEALESGHGQERRG